MNDIPANQTVPPKLRDTLIDAILFRIEQDVQDELPVEFAEGTRQRILEEIIPNSKFILGNLTTEELQSDLAFDRHIAGVLRTTRYLTHRIQEQRQRQEQTGRS